MWTAGQVVGLIDDVPSCEELLDRIEQVIFKQSASNFLGGGRHYRRNGKEDWRWQSQAMSGSIDERTLLYQLFAVTPSQSSGHDVPD